MMTFGEASSTGGGAAEWFIWHQDAIPAIHHALNKRMAPGGHVEDLGDAEYILNANYWIDSEMRGEIFHACGIAPWRVHQRPGDAVFIPPRSPHQVMCTHHILLAILIIPALGFKHYKLYQDSL
jgi:hypothetical protein